MRATSRGSYSSRDPELDEDDLAADLAAAVEVWRSREKWPRLVEIVERVLGKQRFEDGSTMREEYTRWRKRLKP